MRRIKRRVIRLIVLYWGLREENMSVIHTGRGSCWRISWLRMIWMYWHNWTGRKWMKSLATITKNYFIGRMLTLMGWNFVRRMTLKIMTQMRMNSISVDFSYKDFNYRKWNRFKILRSTFSLWGLRLIKRLRIGLTVMKNSLKRLRRVKIKTRNKQNNPLCRGMIYWLRDTSLIKCTIVQLN